MGIIRRQSIYYTVISYIGLGIGAVNTLLLLPHFLTHEQVGLISVFTAISFPLAAIANLGSIFSINRFLPYYKKLLPPEKIDLPLIAVLTGLAGFCIVISLVLTMENTITKWFSHATLLLEYFYLIPFFTLGYMLCSIFQALNNGYFYTVWVGTVTEVIFRIFNLVLIVMISLNVFDFNWYIHLYTLIFWLGLILYWINLKQHGNWYFFTKISLLTKRIKGYMFQYSSFFWFTSVFSVLATMIDTLVLAGVNGLEKSGSLMIATYFITVTQIPQRSMVSVSIPVIAESWRNKDMINLRHVYWKSANNMLWAGGFIYLCILLNINEILSFLPESYHEIKWVVVILGLARLIDYATGVNQNILALSRKNWKFDFYTNILLVVMLIPLNFFLIRQFSITGAAWANVIGYFVYNTIRTIYLYKVTGLSPFNRQNFTLILIVLTLLGAFTLYLSNTSVSHQTLMMNVIFIGIKSAIFLLFYMLLIYLLKASEDLKDMILGIRQVKKILTFFRLHDI